MDGRTFRHSFGSGGSRLRNTLEISQLPPRVQKTLSQYHSGERAEAEAVSRLGSSVEAGGDKEPITLFHLRDALTVSVVCWFEFSEPPT